MYVIYMYIYNMNRFSFRVQFPVYFRLEKCSAEIAVQTKLMSGTVL